jgi:hypothetical protein
MRNRRLRAVVPVVMEKPYAAQEQQPEKKKRDEELFRPEGKHRLL